MSAIRYSYGEYAAHGHRAPCFSFARLHVSSNAHHLRELDAAHKLLGQRWAGELIGALVETKGEVDATRASGVRPLAEERLTCHDRRYSRILREGRAELEQLKSAGTRRQHKATNRHARLRRHMAEALAFLHDLGLPFDNNLAEREVRMIKIKHKIPGGLGSMDGA